MSKKKLQPRLGNRFVLKVPTEQWFRCYDTPRNGLFTRESNRHPAKMAVGLCFRILEHGEERGYWKKGDLILDPMCGIGTTLVCAARRGYNAVGVELEQHFFDLAVANIKHAVTDGRAVIEIHCGDARQLPQLLAGTERAGGDSDLPPFFNAPSGGGINIKGYGPDGADKVGERTYSTRTVSGALTSPPYTDAQVTGSGHFRSSREPNAADAASNPREGYDAALCSPPYGDAALPSGVPFSIRVLAREGKWDEAMAEMEKWDAQQIESGAMRSQRSPEGRRKRLELAISQMEGNYASRASAVVSSPPYLMTEGGAKGIAVNGHTDDPALADRQYKPENHGTAPAQIGNLRDPRGDIDAVLTSPPWEIGGCVPVLGKDVEKAARLRYESQLRARAEGRFTNGLTYEVILRQMQEASRNETYGHAPGQIGRERGETYCSAMLQVYRGMWQVLRESAVVALVTKNPVKDGELRRLDLDTIRLMEAAGFRLLEHHHAMLAEEKFPLFPGTAKRERKSFFKRLYESRGGIRVDWEDVLFFRRVP